MEYIVCVYFCKAFTVYYFLMYMIHSVIHCNYFVVEKNCYLETFFQLSWTEFHIDKLSIQVSFTYVKSFECICDRKRTQLTYNLNRCVYFLFTGYY